MSGKHKRLILLLTAGILIGGAFWFARIRSKTIVIEMAVYSGNSWGIPQAFVYSIYDRAAEMFLSRPENRNIRIVYKTGTMYNHYSEWLAQRILKGKEPDLFLLVEEDFNTYASIGLLQNLNGFISKDPDFPRDSYYSRGLDAGVFNGAQYSLPLSVVPSFLAVNETLLAEYGIAIDRESWNWSQFYEICRDLTKDTDGDGEPDTFGVYGYDWHHAFYTNDEYLFYPDNPRIGFDSGRMAETLDYLKKMHQLNQGKVVREEDFENGRVGFKNFNFSEYKVYGTYPYRILKYENFEWGAIPLPAGPGGRSASKLYTLQVGMSSRSRHKDAAFSFLKFLTGNKEFQQEIWNRTNTLPANKNVVNVLYAKENSHLEEMNLLSYPLLTSLIQNSYSDPDFKWYAAMDDFIGQKISQIVVQDTDTEEGVKNLRKDIEKILKNFR
jgi:multiple sugar transport system substrate-binding protein